MKIRTLTETAIGEWQWTEAVDADAPDGATVAEYVEVMHDSTAETHLGVVVVGSPESDAMAVPDIRVRIHRHIGTLVAWVPRDGRVRYELVEE